MAELGLGVSFLFFHDSLGKELESTKMVAVLQSSFGTDQPFTQSMDYAQYRFNCCGVESEADYEKSSWRSDRLGGNELIVPWTCCPLDESASDYPPFMNPLPLNKTACQTYANNVLAKPHRYKEVTNSAINHVKIPYFFNHFLHGQKVCQWPPPHMMY